MAMLSLLFLALSFAGLFFSQDVHMALGAAFVLTALIHNWNSRAFYGKVFSSRTTGRRSGDLWAIGLIGLAVILLAASGILMLAAVLTPWFLAPWVWMHRIAAAAIVVLALLHMKQEWS